MYLYNKKSTLNMQINDLQSYMHNKIEFYESRKSDLNRILEEICDIFGKIPDFDNTDELFNILKSLKHSLDKADTNIEKLNELSTLLSKLQDAKKRQVINIKIHNFNELSSRYDKEINENSSYIDSFIIKYASFCASSFNLLLKKSKTNCNTNTNANTSTETNTNNSTEINSINANTKNNNTNTNIQINNANTNTSNYTNIEQKAKSESEIENSVDETQISDNNILLISETKGKVFLPYKLQTLKNILEDSSNNYETLCDIINDKFVLPISRFKNPMLSRFKETFNLIKNKEKKSIFDAFSLGLELSQNSFLHPAIIAACNSLDELDIYLDYLEENKPENFDIFEIKYEIPPTKK